MPGRAAATLRNSYREGGRERERMNEIKNAITHF